MDPLPKQMRVTSQPLLLCHLRRRSAVIPPRNSLSIIPRHTPARCVIASCVRARVWFLPLWCPHFPGCAWHTRGAEKRVLNENVSKWMKGLFCIVINVTSSPELEASGFPRPCCRRSPLTLVHDPSPRCAVSVVCEVITLCVTAQGCLCTVLDYTSQIAFLTIYNIKRTV